VLFFLGLIVGSFLNSFLWRYQEKVTYAGRSMCPCCKRQISWYDNIPVLSWFLLSGKCRYCKKSISIQYPVVEVLTGFSFASVGIFSVPGRFLNSAIQQFTNFQQPIAVQLLVKNFVALVILLFITAVMITISVYDFKTKEIPNGFNLTFVIAAFLYLVIPSGLFHSLTYHLLASFVAFVFFYSFVYFSKETWMGGGDAKFAIGMGLLLGPAGTFLAIMIASIVGSIYGLATIAVGKINNNHSKLKQNSKYGIGSFSHEIPFGPFLALGTLIVVCFGPQIIDIYVKIVLGL